MIELDLSLSVAEVLPWIKVKPENLDSKQKVDIERAIEEVMQLSSVAYVYNLDADLDFFEFEEYKPPFPLKRLSLACVTLGSDIDSAFEYYSKKGMDYFRYLLENSANALVEKIVDYVNFLICSSKSEGEKQSFRKSPGIGRVPLIENKRIAEYLYLDKIGVKVRENFSLSPKKTVIFFVEWGDLQVEHHEFKKRCNHCGQSPCIYRI
ncbi:hypothetical protein TTHT_1434 [Thermotomaculum hydrothermale]|uniref:Vitamin B12 dependent methionine synthase activation region n=1 Tax=Thermotomaculum hydrothermale TaxID=981385 RepID=A0A7R6PY44_9BACT|nr:hypothetical protein [Thermotomaculum hydrothermale]BBB32945.1 hypothetical protein TTHT_1434 [Thermotomaculum hydrothermale]